MKKILYFFYLVLIFSNITLNANDDLNASIKTYKNIDEQKIFNVVKNMYESVSPEYIIDTTWDKLHVMKRSTYGFINIDINIENFVLTYIPTKDKNSTKLKLEIFITTQDPEKIAYAYPYIHKLFWNRLNYALGIDKKWMECGTTLKTEIFIKNSLCKIKKESITP